jgi:hypothetical protein
MINFKLWVGFLLIAGTMTINSALANGASERKLPRAYGQIHLGMSVEEFKKIANVVPVHCATCDKDETQALLSPEKLGKPKLVYLLRSSIPQSVNLFFYKGALYGMVFLEIKDTSKEVIDRYEKALGKPKSIKSWDSGLSQALWEDHASILTLTFATKERGADLLRVDYIDKNLASKVPDFFAEQASPSK